MRGKRIPRALSSYGAQSIYIRITVMNGNLNLALTFIQRVMTSSGIEHLIRNAPTRHYKMSEKRVFSMKALERRLVRIIL
uniref:Uncharacterized protein n=1 Tax=Kalanchoe fedtschenkoi TaxID=63787 RepID=A0A7N0VH47_KALFE